MLKKLLWIASFIGVLSFISCGGGSEKAKELLKEILSLVGIPQEVVMNICQDSNNNDFCESIEIQAKVTIKEGDSMATIWEKITQTAEGQYLLETATPCTPILLELQDSDVEYDDGQFTLKYSGIEFGQTEKELSVLGAMVDGEYIASSEVVSIKKLNQIDAQNSFYATIYKDLKSNINILREAGLTKIQAIRGTLTEMAKELSSYGVASSLPDTINGCGADMDCVNNEMIKLSSRLIIDDNESIEIVNTQKNNSSPLSVREVSCEQKETTSEGKVTFNYSKNYGEYTITTDIGDFTTMFSKSSDTSIHFYSDADNVDSIARIEGYKSINDFINNNISNIEQYNDTSRVRTINLNKEHLGLFKNKLGYLIIKVTNIKDNTRGDSVDEVSFEYKVVSKDSILTINKRPIYNYTLSNANDFGTVTFNYSDNNGEYTISNNKGTFGVDFSKASDTSIYFYSDADNIDSVALIEGYSTIDEFVNNNLSNIEKYDYTKRVRTIELNKEQLGISKNSSGYLIVNVTNIKDDSRSDDVDEVTFNYKIISK